MLCVGNRSQHRSLSADAKGMHQPIQGCVGELDLHSVETFASTGNDLPVTRALLVQLH